MPRVRALLFLGIVVVNQAACHYSWQATDLTPQPHPTQHPPEEIRITPKNENGDPNFTAAVVLREVRVSRDSIFGRGSQGQAIAFSFQEVAAMEVRKVDGVRTGVAVLVGAALAAVGFYLFACSDGFTSLGSADCP